MNSTSDCGQRMLVVCIFAPGHDGKLRKITLKHFFYFSVVEALSQPFSTANSASKCVSVEDCCLPPICTVHHSSCAIHILSEVHVNVFICLRN